MTLWIYLEFLSENDEDASMVAEIKIKRTAQCLGIFLSKKDFLSESAR